MLQDFWVQYIRESLTQTAMRRFLDVGIDWDRLLADAGFKVVQVTGLSFTENALAAELTLGDRRWFVIPVEWELSAFQDQHSFSISRRTFYVSRRNLKGHTWEPVPWQLLCTTPWNAMLCAEPVAEWVYSQVWGKPEALVACLVEHRCELHLDGSSSILEIKPTDLSHYTFNFSGKSQANEIFRLFGLAPCSFVSKAIAELVRLTEAKYEVEE